MFQKITLFSEEGAFYEFNAINTNIFIEFTTNISEKEHPEGSFLLQVKKQQRTGIKAHNDLPEKRFLSSQWSKAIISDSKVSSSNDTEPKQYFTISLPPLHHQQFGTERAQHSYALNPQTLVAFYSYENFALKSCVEYSFRMQL
ncbi:hypothetical protein TNCV_966231 [Trichonephila clavipes]|nr:hypothetical protein TNCV_966231 [Trichonephila clavipes]